MNKTEIIKQAKSVLTLNDRGSYTIPAEGLYPHQWFWDSCFIAIGMSNYDVDRAQTEILSLLRGQWSNGMLPNIIFGSKDHDSDIWRSWISPYSPDDVATTGITQPPMLAEAIVRIGAKLPITERRSWYRMVLPGLINYHQWLYSERDPHEEGLALLIHPWESGLDNTPPWMSELHNHLMPWWVRLIDKFHLIPLVNIFRRDTKHIPIGQRPSTIEELTLFSVQRRLRRKSYNIDKILPHGLFAIEDLTFNCILIRANEHLKDIAKSLRFDLPDNLVQSMEKTIRALDELWDPYTGQYYCRNFITHELIKESSIATLMPLYTGILDKERATKLVKLLENKHIFGCEYPVPTTPLNSIWFNENRYWQGPSWVNTNWLIIDGLKRSGFSIHAEALVESTLEMVYEGGFHEYFNPTNGKPDGSANFSWTAALVIDLANSYL